MLSFFYYFCVFLNYFFNIILHLLSCRKFRVFYFWAPKFFGKNTLLLWEMYGFFTCGPQFFFFHVVAHHGKFPGSAPCGWVVGGLGVRIKLTSINIKIKGFVSHNLEQLDQTKKAQKGRFLKLGCLCAFAVFDSVLFSLQGF